MVEVEFSVVPTPKLKVDMTQFTLDSPQLFDLPQPVKVGIVRITRKEGLELVIDLLPEE